MTVAAIIVNLSLLVTNALSGRVIRARNDLWQRGTYKQSPPRLFQTLLQFMKPNYLLHGWPQTYNTCDGNPLFTMPTFDEPKTKSHSCSSDTVPYSLPPTNGKQVDN